MKEKIARFIVEKRFYMLGVLTVLVIISIFLIPKVKINYDIAKYLPNESDTTIGLNILKEEFTYDGTLQVMVEDVSKDKAREIHKMLSNIEHITSVSYDEASLDYYKEIDGINYALFKISVDGDEYSENASLVYDNVTEALKDYKIYRSEGVAQSKNLSNAMESEITIIMIISVAIVAIVLLITCSSFLEPLIFGVTILFSILINMGTNYFLKEVSYITQAITAILQLALSMDYAIILFNRYHQVAKDEKDDKEAMIKALGSSMMPISASSLTTVASLIAIMFMTLRIGFDMGMVLAKGIIITLICVFLMVPALTVIFHKLVKKTTHKQINFKGQMLSKVIFKGRYIIAPLTIVLIIVGFALQTQNEYSFLTSANDKEEEKVNEVFTGEKQMLILYENGKLTTEEEKEFISKIYAIEGTKNVLATSNVNEMMISYYYTSSNFGIDLELSKLVFALYHMNNDQKSTYKLTIKEVIDTAFVVLDSDFVSSVDDNMKKAFNGYKKVLNISENAYLEDELIKILEDEEIKTVLQLTPENINTIYSEYYTSQGITDKKEVKVSTLLRYLNSNEGLLTSLGDAGNTITSFYMLYDNYTNGTALHTYNNIKTLLKMATGNDISSDLLSSVYAYNMVMKDEDIKDVALGSLIEFLMTASKDNEVVKMVITNDQKEALTNVSDILEEQFIGSKHTRILVEAKLGKSQSDIFEYVEKVKTLTKEEISNDSYLAGGVVSAFDIKDTFSVDLLRITLISFISILLIVMIGFKSLIIPVILTLTIQGAIWISLAINFITGEPVFFMSYIVVSAIQMGATIDYGIVITTSYVEKRKTLSKKESVTESIKAALPSIFTSGLILITAGYTVGIVATQVYIYSIGLLLGRGTIISCILVLIFLPTILYIFDRPIEKFTLDANFYNEKEAK